MKRVDAFVEVHALQVVQETWRKAWLVCARMPTNRQQWALPHKQWLKIGFLERVVDNRLLRKACEKADSGALSMPKTLLERG